MEKNFNSHPHKEDDHTPELWVYLNLISTHILTRRMTSQQMNLTRRKTFQLTSSQGGWLLELYMFRFAGYFNSHPHKEDDVWHVSSSVASTDFNSHPHKEDDDSSSRSTDRKGRFQLTSSQGGWRKNQQGRRNTRIFQLTSSQGGWPRDDTALSVSYIISTHILTRRMTFQVFALDRWCSVFQLTSSQGGWRRAYLSAFGVLIFQLTSSQGGWLWSGSDVSSCSRISTHILTRRMTSHEWRTVLRDEYFNSHPHKEDDRLCFVIYISLFHFNSHPHKEDDPLF